MGVLQKLLHDLRENPHGHRLRLPDAAGFHPQRALQTGPSDAGQLCGGAAHLSVP